MINPYEAPPAEVAETKPAKKRAHGGPNRHQRLIKFCIFALFASALIISMLVTVMNYVFYWLR